MCCAMIPISTTGAGGLRCVGIGLSAILAYAFIAPRAASSSTPYGSDFGVLGASFVVRLR